MQNRNHWRSALPALGLCLLLAFAGCGKDNENEDEQQPAQIQKHNVELKYNGTIDGGCVHIAMDTIRKYNADPTVDSIFMIAYPYYQFETWNTRDMKSAVNYLRERHNVNPNKVFGKGDLKLNYYSVDQNPEIVRFLADTLKYHLVYDNQPNSK